MKKLILLIAVTTFMVNNIRAQENVTDFRDQLQFGVKVGGNYSNVYDTKGNKFDADPKLGLTAGVFVAIPIGEYLGVQPELMFSQKGSIEKGSLLGYDYKNTTTTNYIDVPLLLAFKPSEFLTVLAGPQYSYLIKQVNSFISTDYSSDQEQVFKNQNLRKNILGLVLGADVNVGHFVIGLRASWDMIDNNGDGSSDSAPRYKNVVYQGTVGYRF